jgi:hypothetical protein
MEGILLNPMFAGVAMALSSACVAANSPGFVALPMDDSRRVQKGLTDVRYTRSSCEERSNEATS